MTADNKYDYSTTYWSSHGKHQALAEAVGNAIPISGPCPSFRPALERFRVARNAYYDLYNNGGCNYDNSHSGAGDRYEDERPLAARGPSPRRHLQRRLLRRVPIRTRQGIRLHQGRREALRRHHAIGEKEATVNEFRPVPLAELQRDLLGIDSMEARDPEFRIVLKDGRKLEGTIRFDTKLDLRNPFTIVGALRHAQLRKEGAI